MTTTTKGDRIVERGADLLRSLSEKARHKGGLALRVAPLLAEDSAFLRKLKPSLIAARVRGEAPTDGAAPTEVVPRPTPQPGPRRNTQRKGPNPFLVAGVALAAGVFVAKLIDWRGHAHPRD
jgi:hypothetical protein